MPKQRQSKKQNKENPLNEISVQKQNAQKTELEKQVEEHKKLISQIFKLLSQKEKKILKLQNKVADLKKTHKQNQFSQTQINALRRKVEDQQNEINQLKLNKIDQEKVNEERYKVAKKEIEQLKVNVSQQRKDIKSLKSKFLENRKEKEVQKPKENHKNILSLKNSEINILLPTGEFYPNFKRGNPLRENYALEITSYQGIFQTQSQSYKGYVKIPIKKDLLLDLLKPKQINTIRFWLCEQNQITYDLTVEISTDGVTWKNIYNNSYGKSWQITKFKGQLVKYIRFFNRNSKSNKYPYKVDNLDIIKIDAFYEA